MKQLITGGARSGKSALAEQLALAGDKTVVYLATADARRHDEEMRQRVAHHRRRRPDHWETVESPLQLAASLEELNSPGRCVLVDCLTLWLSNCLFEQSPAHWQTEREHLLAVLPTMTADVLLIGNELGSGVIPMGEETRRFVDENGFLHQALAPLCDRVILTAAGLPLVLKGPPLS